MGHGSITVSEQIQRTDDERFTETISRSCLSRPTCLLWHSIKGVQTSADSHMAVGRSRRRTSYLETLSVIGVHSRQRTSWGTAQPTTRQLHHGRISQPHSRRGYYLNHLRTTLNGHIIEIAYQFSWVPNNYHLHNERFDKEILSRDRIDGDCFQGDVAKAWWVLCTSYLLSSMPWKRPQRIPLRCQACKLWAEVI